MNLKYLWRKTSWWELDFVTTFLNLTLCSSSLIRNLNYVPTFIYTLYLISWKIIKDNISLTAAELMILICSRASERLPSISASSREKRSPARERSFCANTSPKRWCMALLSHPLQAPWARSAQVGTQREQSWPRAVSLIWTINLGCISRLPWPQSKRKQWQTKRRKISKCIDWHIPVQQRFLNGCESIRQDPLTQGHP